MESVDCVVHARWIAPVEPPGLLEHHALVVDGGRIVDCLPSALADTRYQARERLTRPSHLLTPGLVNAEVDLGASLWRSSALAEPRRFAAAPDSASAEALSDSITLGLAESLCAGITTSADLGHSPHLLAPLAAALGLRVVLGLPISALRSSFASGVDEHFDRALILHDEYRDHPLVRTAFAPRTLSDLPDATLTRLRVLADQLERTVFLAPTEAEVGRLRRLGLWNAGTTALHFHGTAEEAAAPGGVSVVHCPGADLARGDRPAPAARLVAAGLNVALGSGTFPAARDLCDVMRLTSRLAGLEAGAPRLRPEQLLRMATWSGAVALGMEDAIGSLGIGKRADFVCFDLSGVGAAPVIDPLACLCATVGREAVSDVFVAGRALLAQGRARVLDVPDLIARINEHHGSSLATCPPLAQQ